MGPPRPAEPGRQGRRPALAGRGRPAAWWFAVVLPAAVFVGLAIAVGRAGPRGFDVSPMAWLYDHASPGLDRFFAQVARAGYEGGVIPADILLLAGLAAVGRWRAWRFAAVSLGGSALLVMAAKRLLRRERPALWETIPQETTWSFPSGHATASMALAAVLVLLAWSTRARWPVLLAALAFVPLVGLSRPYLGVHYPSDILAGWCLALAWVAAAWLLLHRRGATG